VVDESYDLSSMIYEYTEIDFRSGMNKLRMLFVPLNNGEEKRLVVPMLQESKAKSEYGDKPFLIRFYGLRIGDNSFVITGGAIKLTHRMKDHVDTNQELIKMESAKQWLISKNIISQEALTLYYG
jgi:hypothetical protein